MGWYRRSLGVFRNAIMGSSKRLPRNPFPGKIHPLFHQQKMGFYGSSLLSSRFGHVGRLIHAPKTLPVGYGRRFYYVDRGQVSHFRQRGFKKWDLRMARNVLIAVLVWCGCVSVDIVYFGNLETIPFTKRTHCVIMSQGFDKWAGEWLFKVIKDSYKEKILPDMHPDSMRLKSIGNDVIEALERCLWGDHGLSGAGFGSWEEESKVEGDWRKESEILKTSREKGEARRGNLVTRHLENVKWELIVIDEPDIINAFCLPGGKIVVFTGLLKVFKTKAELATIIGHEVGHIVARHGAENVTMGIFMGILWRNRLPKRLEELLTLPFSRKMEVEADYIGLLLLASAGYDPRIAPTVYEKLGEVGGHSGLEDYFSTHPSGKTRAKLLAQSQVMQEAISLYTESPCTN